MKTTLPPIRPRGFTLMETVIAIGVLSVLLTGFLIVFIPAADGIKKSIHAQDADRLVSALENELTTVRNDETDDYSTGFAKAFDFIKGSTGPITDNQDTAAGTKTDTSILLYHYRAKPGGGLRIDGTPPPVPSTAGLKAGSDYVLMPMMRRKNSLLLLEDLPAIEGNIYLVKCVQMVHVPDSSHLGQFALKPLPGPNATGPKLRGEIYDPAPNSEDIAIATADAYPDTLIAFAAEFYAVPGKSAKFLENAGFTDFYRRSVKPSFTRNLAVRR